jgi:hypothetical protein
VDFPSVIRRRLSAQRFTNAANASTHRAAIKFGAFDAQPIHQLVGFTNAAISRFIGLQSFVGASDAPAISNKELAGMFQVYQLG